MAEYQPDADTKTLIEEINQKFNLWRQDRQVHEQQWFLNAAFYRGQQYVEWSARDNRLTVTQTPAHRIRLVINRIKPKIQARIAKFLKNRPRPVVVAATTEFQDRLNAKATEKTLVYHWRKQQMESKFHRALLWSKDCGRSFWWFYWDESIKGRVQVEDQHIPGKTSIEEAILGDVCVEVGSAFEVLVADPSCAELGEQPEIMRVKLRPVEDVQRRYQEFAELIQGTEAATTEALKFEQQISGLNSMGLGARENTKKTPNRKLVLVKEHFVAPCGKYPEGAYRVLAGDVLVKNEPALPYGFSDLKFNPFPCESFVDVPVAGQFWGPTLTEQLIGIQREYNLIRSKIAEQIRIMAFPKLLAAKQHGLKKGTWNSEAGEMLEYLHIPNTPPPQPWHPPNIISDAWNALALIQKEFDDITQVFPVSEGKTGGTNSGFQANLLQEATDSVHGPDIQMHDRALERSFLKIRRLIKLGYDPPRLIATIGKSLSPEVFEFSGSQIDEFADIQVQTGSSLPDQKYSRIQAVLDLQKAGLFGQVGDPEANRKVLALLEMGDVDEAVNDARKDEDEARLENLHATRGMEMKHAEFFEDHNIHYRVHTELLKSPESREWPEEQRLALITHVLGHMEYLDPLSAFTTAQEYGLDGMLKPTTHQAVQAQQRQQQMQMPATPQATPAAVPPTGQEGQ